MGILRIYLALCVVVGHAHGTLLPWTMHNAVAAVQIFFVISGFYMALIFDRYASVREFYFSRFLRIFVPYWAIMLLVLAVSLASGLVLGDWGYLYAYPRAAETNGSAGFGIAALSNITLFFQDSLSFLAHDAGQPLTLTTNGYGAEAPLHRFLLVPQAWSIGLELVFYLFVPLLVKLRTRTLAGLILLSLALRILAYKGLHLDFDPWTTRFFPFEAAIFSMGILSYRLWERYRDRLDRILAPLADTTGKRWPLYLVQIALLLGLFWLNAVAIEFFSHVVSRHTVVLAAFVGWALLLPAIFSLSRHNRLDKSIGELSYPVYLVHLLILFALSLLLTHGRLGNEIWDGLLDLVEAHRGETASLLSILLSIAILAWLILPLDRHRYGWAKRWARITAPKEAGTETTSSAPSKPIDRERDNRPANQQ